MAAELGLDRKYGIRLVPRREASWAAVRDKLVNGELDAGQALYGMVYGVELGIGGLQTEMAVLMTLNQNGQAITLSSRLAAAGVTDGTTLAAHLRKTGQRAVFAQTFPTGTHALWLNYWLAAHGIDPLHDVRTVTVPPQQMVANIAQGRIEGFCAGEPWHARAISDGAGFTAQTSQQIWPDHPEKVLATTAAFAARPSERARALVAALLDAARYIDASDEHRAHTVATLASARYIDIDPAAIAPRMHGRYANGTGRNWTDTHPLRFHAAVRSISLSVRCDLVHDPAQALGPVECAPRLPRGLAPREPHRPLRRRARAARRAAARWRAAPLDPGRWRRLGRRGPASLCGQFFDSCLSEWRTR